MKQLQDVNVRQFTELITPEELKQILPLTEPAAQAVQAGRETIKNILLKQDRRMLVIAGPCSIHDEAAAYDYARRLQALSREVSGTQYLVMRVYFEKPRTTVGWKGLINDPHLDGSYDMVEGLKKSRRILLEISEMGMPVATEMLEPITPQYIANLISWVAIGARTTESQIHREMASGLSMPVGLKNSTDGSMSSAVNGMLAARAPQHFLGINEHGKTCIVTTAGNPWVHVVLRGGTRPNYDSVSIEEIRMTLKQKQLPEAIIVDCSHANSRKKHAGQATVWYNCIDQRLTGNDDIVGLMLESNIFEGAQSCDGDKSKLAYGVSITDECISWETTEALIRDAHEKLTRR